MLIYGLGAYAKLLVELLDSQGIGIEAIFDDNAKDVSYLNIPVYNYYNINLFPNNEIIIGVGNNKFRKEIAESLKHNFGKFVHKSAFISKTSNIGQGTILLQNAVIQNNSQIGNNCLLNMGSVIDHDCIIGNFCSIGPNATLCNNVTLGEGVLIGAGAVINKNITIGDNNIINAGAVISNSILNTQRG